MVFDFNTIYNSGSGEQLPLDEVINKIKKYISEHTDVVLSVGTDSMTRNDTVFVLAIVLYTKGKGGIYFYKKFHHERINSLYQKLYDETQLSLDVIEFLATRLDEFDIDLSIHLDIGEKGASKALIRELEGWVENMGYEYEIKPNSYAASTIANIYSK